jgi:hypothetical protein
MGAIIAKGFERVGVNGQVSSFIFIVDIFYFIFIFICLLIY